MSAIGPSCIYQPRPWQIVEDGFDPEFAARNESVFTVGNGFLGIRGFFEEDYCEEHPFGSVRSLYLNGFYDIAPIEYPEPAYGYARLHQSMLSVAQPSSFVLAIDGEEVCVTPEGVGEYERTLDFQKGSLVRSFVWSSRSGDRFRFQFTRLASFPRHHLCANALEVHALDNAANLTVRSQIELSSEKLVDPSDPRVGGGDGSMGAPVRDLKVQEDVVVVRQRASRSYHELVLAVSHRSSCEGDGERGLSHCDKASGALTYECELTPDAPFRVEKFAAYFHSIETKERDLEKRACEEVRKACDEGMETLLEEQAAYLAQFWDECDVKIEGDVALQQGIRFALFQLLQSVGRDGKSNVAAKGLTGEGYGGHYFWDTEIYVLPFFTWTKPEIAKALLRYRYSILNRARERAAELGHEGALFPWRTISGDEASSFFPAGTAQYHINADIAFAISKYVDVTGDTSMLAEFGAEILFEVARFFVSLGSWIPGKGFCFYCVTGPDEYTACVDNNAYTNIIVREALSAAVRAQQVMKSTYGRDWNRLQRDLSLSEAECEEWQRCADGVYVPFDEKRGLIAQDDSFLSKPEWDFAGTPRVKYPLLLHYHYLNIYRHQVLKQADVLMAIYLMPEQFSQAVTTRCFEYYEPRTTHDSSLSPAVHAAVAANIGKPDYAYEYFDRTARLDLDDFCGNTQDGLHIASLAGSWGALFYGFLGVQIRDGLLRFRPSLPTQWENLQTRLHFQGRVIEVFVTTEEIEYRLVEGAPLEMLHYHETFTLGDPVEKRRIAPYLRAVIFDLDGVITDTAEYHFESWKWMADELGVPFSRADNEQLKGVSRTESLERILGARSKDFSEEEKKALASKKNEYYRELLQKLDEKAILPGVLELLQELRKAGVKTAIASSSKNARFILERLGLTELFDAIADGSEVLVSKPDPEVFLLAAKKLGVRPCNCIGVEDAQAGIEAINSAGMTALGVVSDGPLSGAAQLCDNLTGLRLQHLLEVFQSLHPEVVRGDGAAGMRAA
ncbi:beta-phosphoglucomutase [bacterium]|nr:beta-phosphoglucomutase [bacterium]